MTRSILVTTDAFRVGGRETFLETIIGQMREQLSTHFFLLADVIDNDRVASLFDAHSAASAHRNGRAWLSSGVELVDSSGLALIWAQHYKTLGAWLLAARFGKPLLTTFHGPPLGAGYVTSPLDALGIVLCIFRGGTLSAVSPEIKAQLVELGAKPEAVYLIPNRVRRLPAPETMRTTSPASYTHPKSLVLLSRRQKLDHMRAALLFFGTVYRLDRSVNLIVYSDLAEEPSDDGGTGALRQLNALFGRKWLIRHPQVWPALKHVTLAPYTTRAGLCNSPCACCFRHGQSDSGSSCRQKAGGVDWLFPRHRSIPPGAV